MKISGEWYFPGFLNYMMASAKYGGGQTVKIHNSDLRRHGFTSRPDVKRKMRALAKAWRGIVRIRVDTREPHRITIHFYSAEVKAKRS
ncbi:MAG: hypothetical protein Q8P82_01155 [bacterium]|nr:hypothetical protein [bacterium]